jgi:hypothetical protein
MDAVTAEATAPPLPFPWKQAWPLVAGLAGGIVWLIAARLGWQSDASGPDVYAWFEMIVPMATEWVAAGLVMSLAVTVLGAARVGRRAGALSPRVSIDRYTRDAL